MRFSNILHLGIKEMRSLARDPVMLVLIVFAFTFWVHAGATAMPELLNRAQIAIVDEDRSPLSTRIADSFQRPYFAPPEQIDPGRMDARMDAGRDTFALVIPAGFQRDILAGHPVTIQLNVDATRITQAFTGSGYIQAIVMAEVREFTARHRGAVDLPVDLVLRARFNPELDNAWFGSVMQVINNVTLLSIVLAGAALIRERERGTVEHLLTMPVTPLEIMIAKVWSTGLVVLVASAASLGVVVQAWLGVPVEGSVVLFMSGAALHVFATTSLGIMLATFSRSMPQFGLLLVLVLLPLEMLSGGVTPRESMPAVVQTLMLAAPDTHFVILAQAILYRGAGIGIVWPQFLALVAIGGVLFAIALLRFRRMISTMV
ncbi:ABC transporter permease [Salipiger abyssi]|uniref:ABC transporter permease n=1 Tax=Salipiger abyssi TaxID=1250539 RepID=UPI001A8EADA6|nr:ABC transporter permease [Salipiger abyssi]MBN9890213.1 ABC transporter permease [Salipiger abyssi]